MRRIILIALSLCLLFVWSANAQMSTQPPKAYLKKFKGHIIPKTDGTYDIGTSALRVRVGYFDTITSAAITDLVIGTDVQAWDADLDSYATPTAWRMFYSDAADPFHSEVVLGANGTFLESNGASAAPAFRTLVDGDIPDGITLTNITQITTKPITALAATNWRLFYSGAGAIPIELSLGANGTFLESNGASAAPAFRTFLAADIPDISATYEVQLTNEAGLYAVLDDVTDFVQPGDATTIKFTTVEESADAVTLSVAECSGTLVTNRGWDGTDDQTFTLPEADDLTSAGCKFKFLAVKAATSTADTYFDTEGSTTGIYLDGTFVGSGERIYTQEIAVGEGIVCHAASVDGTTLDWFCDSINGFWEDVGS